jgi:hypothetical protein
MHEMESRMLSGLQGDTGAISSLRILHLYLERLGSDFQEPNQMSHVTSTALNMMGAAIYLPPLKSQPPSLVAAALLHAARQAAGCLPAWPTALSTLTGYMGPSDAAFASCLKAMLSMSRQDSPASHLDLPNMLTH